MDTAHMRKSQPLLSLIIPVFNEEANLVWHHDQIKQYMHEHGHHYEVIYVDDGSRDTSLELIRDICKRDANAHFVGFSRNFGKEAALTAGIHKAKGDVAIGVDADGQYPLQVIETFLSKWREGADVVIGVRASNKGAGLLARVTSGGFYRFLRLLDSQQDVVSGATDFRLIDRRVLDAFNQLTERNRVTRNLIDWLGFKRDYVEFDALERHGGKATYDFGKRVRLALDSAIKHSTKPLQLIGGIGVLISIVSLLVGLPLGLEMYAFGDPMKLAITGTAFLGLFLSLMVGIVLVCQGLLALYLENVYHETQNRPLYVVADEDK